MARQRDGMHVNTDAEFLAGCDSAAMKRTAEGDADANWLLRSSSHVQKCSTQMQKELLERKLFTYFSEWCNTEKTATPGFACLDITVVFNQDGSISFRPASPANNIYLAVPHKLKDPVLAEALQVVKRFFAQTFWCNRDALECIFAALLLALSGVNVDRCFWTIGPGGVGQSLLTHLIHAMLGGLHAFLDTNVFYSDDEHPDF